MNRPGRTQTRTCSWGARHWEPGQDDLPRCLGDGGAAQGVDEGVDLYLRLACVPSSEFPCLWAGDAKSAGLFVLLRAAHPLALLYICASDLR